MLYDPKWNKISLDGFIAWLKKQPQDETFDYVPADNCAIGQYCKSVGRIYNDVCIKHGSDAFSMFQEWNTWITYGTKVTFGTALERAITYQSRKNRYDYAV